jgi:hypothetical protein
MTYTQSSLNTMVNGGETLLEFIRNTEKTFGMATENISELTNNMLNNYVDFLSELWCK